jgi:N-acetylglucosamine-6-phosphate deacetylase
MRYVLPGLVDIHVNGFAGVDYNDADLREDRLLESLAAMRETGVTRCLPTIITSSTAHFSQCATTLASCSSEMIAGLHMEGPYISPLDGPRGAHPLASVCKASIEDFKRRQHAAKGRIKLVTLAPEVPGALPLIEYLVSQNITVGIGHSAADAARIHDAASAGATLSTHLGNGCFSQMDRHNNVLWPQLADDRLIGAFIADGFHLPADVLKAMIKAKGLDRTILVTDAVCAAAAPVGTYSLGPLKIQVDQHRKVTQVGAANLAGSALTMDAAIRNTCRWCGLSIETVWPLASQQAAAAVDLTSTGSVEIEWDPSSFDLKIISTQT